MTPQTPSTLLGAPAPLRPAATVMLVRDGDRGLEVCLLQRNLESAFVGGASLFPGGGVDPADGDPAVAALCDGLTDEEASARLGVASGGLAYWIAAIRESFEEAALLPAHWANTGNPLRFDGDPALAARFAEHRRAVDVGERRLADVAAEEGLRFDLSGMAYVAHWVTPEGLPRRYDTRFFLAAAPPGQRLAHDDREIIAAAWPRPEEVLERHAAGEVSMLPPTVACLQVLSNSTTVHDALTAAAAVEHVPMIMPRVVTSPGGDTRIVIPDHDADASSNDGVAWPPRP